MATCILLRSGKESLFRKAFEELAKSINTNCGEKNTLVLTISSGYFTSPFFSTELINVFTNQKKPKLVLVGCRGGAGPKKKSWADHLLACAGALKDEKLDVELRFNINNKNASLDNWHAKIAVFQVETKDGKKTIAAIVGSSNMTQPAFGSNSSYPIIEADVVLTASKCSRYLGKGGLSEIVKSIVEPNNDSPMGESEKGADRPEDAGEESDDGCDSNAAPYGRSTVGENGGAILSSINVDDQLDRLVDVIYGLTKPYQHPSPPKASRLQR